MSCQCDYPETATILCVECKISFCDDCFKSQHKRPDKKGHKTIHLSESDSFDSETLKTSDTEEKKEFIKLCEEMNLPTELIKVFQEEGLDQKTFEAIVDGKNTFEVSEKLKAAIQKLWSTIPKNGFLQKEEKDLTTTEEDEQSLFGSEILSESNLNESESSELIQSSETNSEQTSSFNDLTLVGINITNFQDLENYTYLEELDLNRTRIDSLDYLKNLVNLRKLNLRGTKITNFQVLNNFQNLEELNLNGTRIDSLEHLKNLLNLRKLNLRGTKISQIDFLKNFTKLNYLNLNNLPIHNIDPLEGLVELRHLFVGNIIGGEKKIGNFKVLKNFTKLEVLNLNRQNVDLKYISELVNLRVLYLSGSSFNEFQVFEKLTNLEELYLNGTYLEKMNLSNLTNLRVLSLTGSKFTKFKILKDFTKLEELHLISTSIKNLRDLENLISLRKLSLSNTEINDFQILKKFTKLEELFLDHTKFKDLTIIENHLNLQILSLKETKIESFKPLRKLIKLTELNLNETKIDNMEHLNTLTELRKLHLGGNNIVHFNIIERFTKLEYLDLKSNSINYSNLFKLNTILQKLNCTVITSAGSFKTEKIQAEKIKIMVMGESGSGKSSLIRDLTGMDANVSFLDQGTEKPQIYNLNENCVIIDTKGFSFHQLETLEEEIYNPSNVDLVLYFTKDFTRYNFYLDEIKGKMLSNINKCIFVLSYGDKIDQTSFNSFQDWFQIRQSELHGKVLNYVIVKNTVSYVCKYCQQCTILGDSNHYWCTNLECKGMNKNSTKPVKYEGRKYVGEPMKICPCCYGTTEYSSENTFWKCKGTGNNPNCSYRKENEYYKPYGFDILDQLISDSLSEVKKHIWFKTLHKIDMVLKVEKSLDLIDEQMKKVSWMSDITKLISELITKITSHWFDSYKMISSLISFKLAPPSNLSTYFHQRHYIAQYGLNCILFCLYIIFQDSPDEKIKKFYTNALKKLNLSDSFPKEDISTKEKRFAYFMRIIQWHLLDQETKKNVYKSSIFCDFIYSYPNTLKWDMNKFFDIDSWKDFIQKDRLFLKNLNCLNDLSNDFSKYLSNQKELIMVTTSNALGTTVKQQVLDQRKIYEKQFQDAKELIEATYNTKLDQYKSISDVDNLISYFDTNMKPPGNFEELVENESIKSLSIQLNNHDCVKLKQNACIIANFLQQIHLHKIVNLDTITFFDVISIGFRHGFTDKYWKSLISEATFGVLGIENDYATFEDGELDHIVFTMNNENFIEVWIVFSGSNSAKDWMHNISTKFASSTSGIRCHEGFVKLWNTFTKKYIDSALSSIERKFKGKSLKFIVCGHSLGGALSILTGNYIKYLNKDNVVQVLVFGTPAVFMEDEETEKYLKKEDIINVANPWDPVFYMNDIFGKFKRTHVGIPVLLNDKHVSSENWFNPQKKLLETHDIGRYKRIIKDLFEDNFQK